MRPSRCQRSVSDRRKGGERGEALGNDGKRRVRGKYSADAIRLASRYVSSGFIQALASSSRARSLQFAGTAILPVYYFRPAAAALSQFFCAVRRVISAARSAIQTINRGEREAVERLSVARRSTNSGGRWTRLSSFRRNSSSPLGRR